MSTDTTPSEATPPPANGTHALEVRGVTKRFGALVVLRGIDLVLRPGEVLGLVGDNGAGKSTLVKILSGFHSQDDGEILIDGRNVNFGSVAGARISRNRCRNRCAKCTRAAKSPSFHVATFLCVPPSRRSLLRQARRSHLPERARGDRPCGEAVAQPGRWRVGAQA